MDGPKGGRNRRRVAKLFIAAFAFVPVFTPFIRAREIEGAPRRGVVIKSTQLK